MIVLVRDGPPPPKNRPIWDSPPLFPPNKPNRPRSWSARDRDTRKVSLVPETLPLIFRLHSFSGRNTQVCLQECGIHSHKCCRGSPPELWAVLPEARRQSCSGDVPASQSAALPPGSSLYNLRIPQALWRYRLIQLCTTYTGSLLNPQKLIEASFSV